MRKRSNWKRVLAAALSVATVGTTALSAYAETKPSDSTYAKDVLIEPVVADYGYYVDVYGTNNGSNMSPESNAAIGVLSQMLEIFTPGTDSVEGANDAWRNGTVLNETTHLENLNTTKSITEGSTKEQQEKAYLDDRRNQNYSMVSGLGVYADEFVRGSGARTSIPDEVPADATTVKYDDAYGDNGPWADEDSEYGDIVKLVNTVRGGSASTSSAKKYYKYARPFRWSDIDESYPEIEVIDILQPCIKADPSNDGGYPSGHTNAAYLAGISMAYAVPEQYQQMIYRASELGNNRIVTGMHSCLDVMGGRTMATAVAAANLNDSKNAEVKANAIAAGEKLVSAVDTQTEYEDYQKDKETYLYRMTYGLSQTGDTNKPMVVPKGAEVLLESRFPYLDGNQRRYVLYTTGIESGYPVLDDAEGWGRLNLFEAASGYGAFVTDVTVDMDAELGGFCASDNWKNDISGEGSLTKEGTGMLTLSGQNTYTGGTCVNEGTVIAASSSAFGKGNVENNSDIVENTLDTVNVSGDYTQGKEAVLELTVSGKEDILKISGNANFHGTLKLIFDNGFAPEDGFTVIESANVTSKFDRVEVSGLEEHMQVVYQDGKMVVSSEKSSTTIDSSEDETKPENSVINYSETMTEEKIAQVVSQVQNAKDGETVTIVMGDAITLPKTILEAAKGKDITLEVQMPEYTWKIAGTTITEAGLQDFNLKVVKNQKNIPENVISDLAGSNPSISLSLLHDGEFGFTAVLTMNVGKENNGKLGKLYYYNSEGKMEFMNKGVADAEGNLSLQFTHASEYVIVLENQQTTQITQTSQELPTQTTSIEKNNIVKTKDTQKAVKWFVILAIGGIIVIGTILPKKQKRI